MGRFEQSLLPVLLEYGGEVINRKGDLLGRFEYLLINTEMATIEYGILSRKGKAASSGNKLYAIPWLAVQNAKQNTRFIIDVKPEQFREAPGFDCYDWPDFADPRYQEIVYGFYYYNSPAGCPAE